MAQIKKVGVLTGGGDCPGLNAAIRAIVYKAREYGVQVIGVHRGWAGLMEVDAHPLTIDEVADIHKEGGTIIYSSRTNPYKDPTGEAKALEGFKKLGLDALIPIGGEDTLGVANKLTKAGLPCVAVPKTIDNDLSATDVTIGFNTAVTIATEAIDRLHTTAKSHNRIMVVEIMGRHAGWMTLISGLAGGAHAILVPEEKFNIVDVVKVIEERKKRGKPYAVIAVSEGALPTDAKDFVTKTKELDAFGHVMLGGIGDALAKELSKRCNMEARAVVLGHTQRGGPPTVYDRILGTKLGYKAMEMVMEGKFGYMAALKGNDAVPVKLEDAVGKLNTVPAKDIALAKTFFG